MNAVPFAGCNAKYAENQPEYRTLHSYRDTNGLVVSCWQMSWRERLTALLTGQVWLSMLTFNMKLQPVLISVERPDEVPDE